MKEPFFTVIALNKFIKSLFVNSPELKNVSVKGEISNCTGQNSQGHIYFSLKDPESLIKCNFFSYQNRYYKGNPLKNGMEVIVTGNVNVYEPNGTYSIQVTNVNEVGAGDIFQKIEKLKAKLSLMGIFSPEHKKPLPFFPKRLGIATSHKGAAIEDILKNALDLNPYLQVLVAPCVVQGEEAPQSIVKAIELLNDPKWEVDVIIAGRGGGSTEDLMAFNSEEVVMAFFNSRVPIVSAVGHEIDRPLSDLAADQYTSTPTAAAKLVVADTKQILEKLEELENRMKTALQVLIRNQKDRMHAIFQRYLFQNPFALLDLPTRKLDETYDRIYLLGKNNLAKNKENLLRFDSLSFYMKAILKEKKKQLEISQNRVSAFSPLGTLQRGFSVLRDKNKKVISSIKKVKEGMELEAILADGSIKVQVKEKSKER